MFSVVEPSSTADIVAALADDPGATIYAGGVQLLADVKLGNARPTVLVSTKHASELRWLAMEDRGLVVGAGLCFRDIAMSPLVVSHAPLLGRACSRIGNPRVRGRGTIGGNVSVRDAKSDIAPVLLIHDAVIEVTAASSIHDVGIEELLHGDRLPRAQLISRLVIRHRPGDWHFGGARRRFMVKPTLSAAVAVRVDDRRVVESRMAIGGLGPVATRLRGLEEAVVNSSLAELKAWATPARICHELEPCEATDDPDASAWYKRRLAGVLLAQSLRETVVTFQNNRGTA